MLCYAIAWQGGRQVLGAPRAASPCRTLPQKGWAGRVWALAHHCSHVSLHTRGGWNHFQTELSFVQQHGILHFCRCCHCCSCLSDHRPALTAMPAGAPPSGCCGGPGGPRPPGGGRAGQLPALQVGGGGSACPPVHANGGWCVYGCTWFVQQLQSSSSSVGAPGCILADPTSPPA